MIIACTSFTTKGSLLIKSLSELLPDCCILEKPENQNLNPWVSSCFEKHIPMVFVGAAGIALRAVAPFVYDKLSDSPVIVIDEKAQFVIPVLSGHAGGANKLARLLARKLNATAVITTATDVEEKFSVDVFAVNNGLKIINREGIQLVSGKVLEGKTVTIWIQPGISYSNENIPEEIKILPTDTCSKADVCIALDASSRALPESLLYLQPKTLCLGMGCKKDKSFEELKSFVEQSLTQEQIAQICTLSSIYIKQKEAGLNILAQYLRVPFETFSSEVLEKVAPPQEGFSESDFVKEVTGVSNVCERAAVCSAGENGKLLVKKLSTNGMTLALAEKSPSIKTWSSR